MNKGKDRYCKSRKLLRKAKKAIAGGVGSNFRAKEQPCPLYFTRGKGPWVWDVDGNRYIDFVLGQGPMLLGHCHPDWVKAMAAQLREGHLYAGQNEIEIVLSEKIKELVPGAEMVRFGNSSSEIIHLAIRVARAHTGRRRLVKMEGHYHGWFDNVLVSVHPAPEQAGRLKCPKPVLESAGQSQAVADDILISHYNDLDHLGKVIKENQGQVAAVLIEPVMCNSGCILPKPGYLEGVQKLCKRHGVVLIFDETITGFRLAPGGAAERFGIVPDLGIFGKGLGGGMPLSCLVGRNKLMKRIADFSVFHAGTFNTNLLAMRGALVTLEVLTSGGGQIYQRWEHLGEKLRGGLRERGQACGVNILVKGIGQVTYTGFSDNPRMETYRDCWNIDDEKVGRWVSLLKERGVRIIPRGIWYLSTVHGDSEIDEAIRVAGEMLSIMVQEKR